MTVEKDQKPLNFCKDFLHDCREGAQTSQVLQSLFPLLVAEAGIASYESEAKIPKLDFHIFHIFHFPIPQKMNTVSQPGWYEEMLVLVTVQCPAAL